MKKRYIYISALVLLFNLLPVQAQINRGHFRMFDEDFDIFLGVNDCCNTETVEDITFEYDITSALYNQQLIRDAMIAHLNAWRGRQEGVLKEEIERQLYQTFPSFTEARNTYFNKIENDNINQYKGEVVNKYSNKTIVGNKNQRKYLKNLKLLKLRENEIISGNNNNSLYANLNFNGTPLNQINNINQLNSLRQNEISIFSDNNWKTHNSKYTLEYLNGISSVNNYSHSIFTNLLYLHLQYYNSFNVWDRVNLMQAYLQHINDPLVVVQPVQLQQYAFPTFIDNYAVNHRGGGLSVFDPDWYKIIAAQIASNGTTSQHVADAIAQDIQENLMGEALNSLMNSTSIGVNSSVDGLIGYFNIINSNQQKWLNENSQRAIEMWEYINSLINSNGQSFANHIYETVIQPEIELGGKFIALIKDLDLKFSDYNNLSQNEMSQVYNKIDFIYSKINTISEESINQLSFVDQQLVVQDILFITMFPWIKDLASQLPSSSEEWKVFFEILKPILLEIGIEFIPLGGLYNSAVDTLNGINSGDWTGITLGIVGIVIEFTPFDQIKNFIQLVRYSKKGVKIFKLTRKFTSVIRKALDSGLKIVLDNNVVKFLNNSGGEVARIVNNVMTFKYTGFGGNVITTQNKTTTVIGKFFDNVNPPGTTAIKNSGLYKYGENIGGINLLDDSNWSWPLNQNWLLSASTRGDVIRVMSNPFSNANLYVNGVNGVKTTFGKEIDYLISLGYTFNSATNTFIR